MKFRWIIAITIAVLVLGWLAIIVVVRQINLGALEKDRAALAAAGVTMRWEDVDVGPEMDPAAEAVWQRWTTTATRISPPPELKSWLAHPTDPVPDTVQAIVSEIDDDLLAVLKLLDTKSLKIGLQPQITRLLRDHIDPQQWFSGAEYFVSCHSLAYYLRCAACISSDPLPSLRRLDHLISALDQPLSALDALIQVALKSIRDDTWLDGVRLGTITEQQARTWLEQDTNPLADIASAWMGDRLYTMLYYESLMKNGVSEKVFAPFGAPTPTWWDRTRDQLSIFLPTTQWQWATLPAGTAYQRWVVAKYENTARLRPPLQAPSGIGGANSIYVRISLPNQIECNITWIEAGAAARIKRAAARILFAARHGESVPMNPADFSARFGADLLAATPGQVALVYSPLPGGGFSLAADLSGPPTIMGMPRKDNRLEFSAAEISAIVARSGLQP